MLGNVMVLVAVLALAAVTAVSSTYAMARVTVVRGAERYVAVGFDNGVTVLRDSLAQQIASGALDPRALPSPMPSVSPLPPARVCMDSTKNCPYLVSETFAYVSASEIQSNLEADAHVNEARIAARISVSVLAPDLSPLVGRTKTVIFRVMSVPPYVAPAGNSDETSGVRDAGDDGGMPLATSAPCSSPQPGKVDETVVRAQYVNDATGKCFEGSSWRSQAASAATSPAW